MHGQINYPKNAYRKMQRLKSLNGLPHGHRPRYAPILCLAHFYQGATTLTIEDRLSVTMAWQPNDVAERKEQTKLKLTNKQTNDETLT